jgi:small subunit ribosomal protein S1
MSSEHKTDYSERLEVDDSYWAALFVQEEVISETEAGPQRPTEELASSAYSWSSNGTAARSDPWTLAQEALEKDEVLQLSVTGHNKGGLLVQWNGLQGFVPASQLVDLPQFHIVRERQRALGQWHGRSLSLKVIEVNRTNNRLILSERAASVEAKERDGLLRRVQIGERLQGLVTNLTHFGAFVDLGGVEGLIHISEISWSRVIHPSHVLQPGQKVEVQVLTIDRQKERIALTMKRLKPDPWENLEQRYRPGQLVEGVVGNIVTYGAFVVLEDELEGLVHISELAEGSFLHPRDVVQQGDRVTARVLHVDSRSKRLSLTLRGTKNSPYSADQISVHE